MTVLFASILNSAIANAADQVCDVATLDAVAKHLKLKDFYPHDFETNAGIVVSVACKAAPQDKNIELTAIAYYSTDNNPSQKSIKEDSNDDYEIQVFVAMIDTTTKHIMASYQSTIFENAAVQVYANSLLLDTGVYQLATSVRAFGLRFDSLARVPSCAEGWQGRELQLFVRDGVALRPVFAIPMNHLLVSNGCINAGTGIDTLYKEANLTVKVLKSSAKGYADLMLNAVINTDGSDPKAQTIKPRVEQQLMQYDGKKYVASKKHAPWWLGSNWALQ